MSELNRTSCCGVREYDGILEFDSVVKVLLDCCKKFYDYEVEEERGWSSGAFIMFTCPAYERRLPKMVKYIEENALGKCTLTESRLNPNSDNNLQVLLFAPNHTKFQSWYGANKTVYLYQVGDKVINVAKESSRKGKVATVIAILDETNVHVKYEDGTEGAGHLKYYKKVD